MKKCDVIIPIYNAYDFVGKCVESVINNTEFTTNKLILIDDKSPDKRIWPLLKKLKSEYKFIDIYQNEENLGFVGTVNKGMRISKNDVVLLNSDTEVTKNWLKKISECAYSMENVATVTPLSNNATLASVPKMFEANDIPEGYTLDEMADLVENCSNNDYPEIPTGHGFCLYIKREVLNELGLFDVEAYGKGYGEENDFCFRCLDHGYRHLLCDNTYIYHKESQSFSESKLELQKSAAKVLRGRYPTYCDRLDLWNQQRKIEYISNNIAFHLGNNKKHKNILCIIHDWNLNNLGGTTLHLYDLIKNLRKHINFHVLTPEAGGYKLYSYWENTETVIKFPAIQEFHILRYFNSDWKLILDNVIKNFKIDLIHIHHLLNNYFDIIDIIEKYKIKTIISLHDYYSVCPLITKMKENKEYCGEYCEKQCDSCLKNTMIYNKGAILNWHNWWLQLLKMCDKIICPSESSKKEILNVYNELKIDVIEHGIDLKHQKSNLNIENEKVLNVAFIGAIGIHKGSKILNELLYKNRSNKIKVHLFGVFDGKLPKNSRYFENHGSYKREDLPKLLKENNIKLVCLLSICPETFSYTLSESVACGIPVLGFNIGAIGERILNSNLGWVMDKNSNSKEVLNKILEIKKDYEGYNQKIISLNLYKLRTTKNMAKDYKKIYNEYLGNEEVELVNANYVFDELKNYNNYGNVVNYSNYAWVFDTLKWKIISKIKIPRTIKKIYRGVFKK